MFISYAQNFEDVMLWRAFRDVEHGFYVDLGAQDPLVDSVSLAFHERGWRGVHVEPSSFYAEALRQHRPGDVVIQAAVGDGASLVNFFEIANSGISTVDPAIAEQHRQRGFVIRESQVPSIPLSAVFDACASDVVHWLKIDIEGSERSALASWGSSTRRPWVVVVECTVPMSQIETTHDWESLLLERDYGFAYFDGLNRFYVAKERSELKSAFSSPPNVFDAFAVSGTASSRIHLKLEERNREQADKSTAAIAALQRRTDELVALHAEQLARAEERMLAAIADRDLLRAEESRMLNEHIRMLLADMQQRQVHAVEERARLHEVQRQALSGMELALVQAGAREETTKAAWKAAETALHAALIDLEKLKSERSLAAAVHKRAEDLHRTESERLRQAIGSQALDARRLAEQLAATKQEVERLQAGLLNRLWRAMSSSNASADVPHPRGPERDGPPLVEAAAAAPKQDAPPLKPDPNAKDPLESIMLDQLLTLNDVDFVRAAYKALLKRDADPSGERNYLELLRSGHDKVGLLGDMSRSEEAQCRGSSIPGLKGALFLRKVGRFPLAGPFALKVISLFRRAPSPDPAAAMWQQALGMQRSVLEMVVQLNATVQKVQHQQMIMEQALRRLSDSELGMAMGTFKSGATGLLSGTGAEELKINLNRKVAAWKV